MISGARIAGKAAPLTPVSDHGFGLLDLCRPDGKAANIRGSQRCRNIAGHG